LTAARRMSRVKETQHTSVPRALGVSEASLRATCRCNEDDLHRDRPGCLEARRLGWHPICEAQARRARLVRIPGPGTIRRAVRDLRRVREGGGPAQVRLERVDRPHGLLFPTAEVTLSVQARSGETIRLTPELPVPWPWAWGYRLGRRLRLPIVSTLEPGDVQLSLPIPEPVGRLMGSRS
jgi:hypothetical protein